MKAGGAAIAGLTLTGGVSAAPLEKLALEGGPKSVTVAEEITAALTRWPRYGDAEKQALHALIDNNKFYDELPLFEDEWKAYTGSPFVKAHMNGSSALTSMYFALDLPPGSEVMVPSYTFFSACLAMRFSGLVPIFVDIDPKTACFDLEDAKRKHTAHQAVESCTLGPALRNDRIWEWCNERAWSPSTRRTARRRDAGQEDRHVGRYGHLQLPDHEGDALWRAAWALQDVILERATHSPP